jgi:hypothetical protein
MKNILKEAITNDLEKRVKRFNAKNGAIVGGALSAVTFGIFYSTNPEVREMPIKELVHSLLLTVPLTITSCAIGFHVMGYVNRKIYNRLLRNYENKNI